MTFEIAAIAVVLVAPAALLLGWLALLGALVAALGASGDDAAGPRQVSRRLRLVPPLPGASTD